MPIRLAAMPVGASVPIAVYTIIPNICIMSLRVKEHITRFAKIVFIGKFVPETRVVNYDLGIEKKTVGHLG
jgi:hypothetical protein